MVEFSSSDDEREEEEDTSEAMVLGPLPDSPFEDESDEPQGVSFNVATDRGEEGSNGIDTPSRWNFPRRVFNRYQDLDDLHQSALNGFLTILLSLSAIGLYNVIVSSIPTIAAFFTWLTGLIVQNILLALLSPIVAFQVWLYKKIRSIQNDVEDMETARPDGGQPRDDQGRFESKGSGTSGGGFVAGAVFGAAMGAQYGGPQGMIAGAILGAFFGNELEKND